MSFIKNNPKGIKKNKIKGFTLLEAMVAITVLSSASLAFYSWYSTSLMTLERANDLSEQSLLMGDLESYLKTLNLQSETRQQFQLNGYTIQLEATLLEPVQESRSTAGALGLYQMGLYRVVLDINLQDRIVGQFETRLVGYRQVRQ